MIAELVVHRLSTGESSVILRRQGADRDGVRFEAPNWSPDGSWLLINSGGRLYRIGPDGGELVPVETGEQTRINNDHCISGDGSTIYFSDGDGHLYAVAATGGRPRRVSHDHGPDFQHYLHGVAPDGSALVYIGVGRGSDGGRTSNVFALPLDGGADVQLTDLTVQNDGCEYTPDGRAIVFNSELAADRPGHAQLFLMDSDGGDPTQLTFDDRVNWFPHPSPDGRTLLYLSYPPGTEGHPPDHNVILRTLPLTGDRSAPVTGEPTDVAALNGHPYTGGQGTINVNSWAPDSDRFGYVRYATDQAFGER